MKPITLAAVVRPGSFLLRRRLSVDTRQVEILDLTGRPGYRLPCRATHTGLGLASSAITVRTGLDSSGAREMAVLSRSAAGT